MQKSLLIFFLTLLFIGCTYTPSNVIDEDDMVDLMVDMHKGEAYMQMNMGKFDNDSLKMLMKQSVLLKHGYSQVDFDTSLVWYAHHIDRYVEVYNNVIKELTEEQAALSKEDKKAMLAANTATTGSRKRYKNTGDTADVWTKERTWMFLPNLGKSVVAFDMRPDRQSERGDRYELSLKLCNPRASLKAYLGIDYSDGSTTFVYRTTSYEGWNKFTLQADTTRAVSRVYGYLKYAPSMGEVAFVDSLELLRTHLDRTNYSIINTQKWIGKKSLLHKDKPVSEPKEQQPVEDSVRQLRPGQRALRHSSELKEKGRPLTTPQLPNTGKMPQSR